MDTEGLLIPAVKLFESQIAIENIDAILMYPKHSKINRVNRLFSDKVRDRIFEIEKPKLMSWTNIIFYKKIMEYIDNFKPDVIHIHTVDFWMLPFIPWLKRYPIIYSVHDSIPHIGENQDIITIITHMIFFLFVNKIMTFSENEKNKIIKHFFVRSKNIFVAPLGIYDMYPGINNSNQNDKNIILFFGRIREYKGIEILIQTEPYLSKRVTEYSIIIAGEGDFSIYQKFIRDSDRFKIINRFISDAEINQLFSQATIVVLPYIDASQSAIIPIAYAFNKPIIASNLPGLKEFVINNETGILVPPKDSASLAKAIYLLLTNKNELKRMSENIINNNKIKFSWHSIAKEVINQYKQVLP